MCHFPKNCGILIGALGSLVFLNTKRHIELAANEYENPAFLLICSCVGWIFLYECALYFLKVTLLKDLFLLFGRNILAILCLHFIFFKIVNFAIVIAKDLPLNQIGAFPTIKVENPLLWIAYILVGIGPPVVLSVATKYLQKSSKGD